MLRVREFPLSESNYVSRLTRTTRDATVRTRAMIVLHSMQGFSRPKIARMVYWSPAWVRRVIRDFDRLGTAALYPNRADGRPPKFTKPIRQKLVDLALSRPRDHGMPLQTWSLERLKIAAIHEGIVESISEERLRKILREEAVSFRAVKTWKTSHDPKFDAKVRRLRALTNREHNPPIVVAADEMGPLSLRPYGGRTWGRSEHPDRVRATYTKTHGTRYLFGMYDHYHDQMDWFLSPSKHTRVWRRFLRFVRAHYPRGGRIYLINDNLSTHWTASARALARAWRITMVPSPTNAWEYNPIEAHFGELKDVGLTASDYPTWRHLAAAVHQAIAYRNRNASPRVHKVKRRLWVRH